MSILVLIGMLILVFAPERTIKNILRFLARVGFQMSLKVLGALFRVYVRFVTYMFGKIWNEVTKLKLGTAASK